MNNEGKNKVESYRSAGMVLFPSKKQKPTFCGKRRDFVSQGRKTNPGPRENRGLMHQARYPAVHNGTEVRQRPKASVPRTPTTIRDLDRQRVENGL